MGGEDKKNLVDDEAAGIKFIERVGLMNKKLFSLCFVIALVGVLLFGSTVFAWENETKFFRLGDALITYTSMFEGERIDGLGRFHYYNYSISDLIHKTSESSADFFTRRFRCRGGTSSSLSYGVMWVYDMQGNNSQSYFDMFGAPVRNNDFVVDINWSYSNFDSVNSDIITDQYLMAGDAGAGRDIVVYQAHSGSELFENPESEVVPDTNEASEIAGFDIVTLANVPATLKNETGIDVAVRNELANMTTQIWVSECGEDFLLLQQSPSLVNANLNNTTKLQIGSNLNVREKVIDNVWIDSQIQELTWEKNGVGYLLAGTLSETLDRDTVYSMVKALN